MLEDFIRQQRALIIERVQAQAATSAGLSPHPDELADGVPVLLDQLGAALRRAASTGSSAAHDHGAVRASSGRHARGLLRRGLTVGQVVHCYGDVCQVITELVLEQGAALLGDEFRILNLCLDDAIAEAVTEFASQRERQLADDNTERLGVLAHELRNHLNVAVLAFESLKSGRVGAGGSTGLVLERSLTGLRHLLDQSLAAVRLDAGIERVHHIDVGTFLEDIEVIAVLQAQARDQTLRVAAVEPGAVITGDREILLAALANLLQNAIKFTPREGRIWLTTRVTADRVSFDVTDECGGLPSGSSEELFRPFEQRGADRSGVGLGLAICRRAARASGGEILVRDLPGTGCVFTLDLPRLQAS